jgi:phospholipid/cholesterol/gamma-HCH transport system substrate-binding protein
VSTRTERRVRRAKIYGAFVIAFFIGLLGLALTATHGLPFEQRTTVKAAFSDVGSLIPGDDVRIANVRVGFVEKVDLQESENQATGAAKQPVLTLKLDDQRPVYKNAKAVTATVGARSALGQKFVELNPGDPSAGPLPADFVIPATGTVAAQEIGDLLAVLDTPTRQSIGSFFRNFGGGLAGHGGDFQDGLGALPDILPDLGTVSTALATDNGRDFTSLLTSADTLSRSFTGKQQQIGELLGKLDTTFAAFNADDGKALGEVLQTAPEALRKGRGALDRLAPTLENTKLAMTEFKPGAESLGRATPDTRGFFRESPQPLDEVPSFSSSARPAFEDLTPTAKDIRPLSRQLVSTFDGGAAVAQQVAPYAPELALFFINATDALKNGNDNFHWLRIAAVVDGTQSLDTAVPVRDPFNARDPYPAPGEASKQARYSGLRGVTGGAK